MLKERDLALNALKENLSIAQNRMKKWRVRREESLNLRLETKFILNLDPTDNVP